MSLMQHLPEIVSFFQVILIDISLSGDNAVVIGMAAAGLAEKQRTKAIIIGIIVAIVLRIIFSAATVHLLGIPGLTELGGFLLLIISWSMFQELRGKGDGGLEKIHPKKTLLMAIAQIVVADVSMSLDNILAVAGAARDHVYVMAFGLILSIGILAFAANLVASLLTKWRWLNYAGLGLILYIALSMLTKSFLGYLGL